MEYVISLLGPMWSGAQVTLKLFVITMALSIPLGLVLALVRISRLRSLSAAVGAYIWLMRGTPLMLQLLFIYFALPFVPYYLQTLGVTDAVALKMWVAGLAAAGALTLMVFAPVWGYLADRFGRRLMMLRANFAGVVILALLAFCAQGSPRMGDFTMLVLSRNAGQSVVVGESWSVKVVGSIRDMVVLEFDLAAIENPVLSVVVPGRTAATIQLPTATPWIVTVPAQSAVTFGDVEVVAVNSRGRLGFNAPLTVSFRRAELERQEPPAEAAA